MLPAMSVDQYETVYCWVSAKVTTVPLCIGPVEPPSGVTVNKVAATPDRLSVAARVNGWPGRFGTGVATVTGAVKSMLIPDAVAVAVLPATSTAVPVADWLAPSVASVRGGLHPPVVIPLVASVQGKSKDLRFVLAHTRTRATAEDFCRSQELALVDSYEKLLADRNVDAVVLATRHSLHESQIIAACYRCADNNILLPGIPVEQRVYHCEQSHKNRAVRFCAYCSQPFNQLFIQYLFYYSSMITFNGGTNLVGCYLQYWYLFCKLLLPVLSVYRKIFR